MGTTRERLWLLGLLTFVAVPGILAVALGAFGPVFPDPVEFHVADDEPLSGVEVRVDRVSIDDDESRTVQRRVLDGGVDVVVFETRTTGAYVVRLSEESRTCTRTVTIRRRDGVLDPTVRRPADGGDCPVSFYVR
jgi:hypothetical protein